VNIEDYEDITPHILPKLIVSAKAWDAEAARRLLGIFCGCVDSNRPVYPELLVYLSVCLGAIADGADVNRALHVARPKHRPPSSEKTRRDEDLVIQVQQLRADGKYRVDAIAEVADKNGLALDTVEKVYKAKACKDRVLLLHWHRLCELLEPGQDTANSG
jgi:hypothetical protein